jgi:hypothetical protein
MISQHLHFVPKQAKHSTHQAAQAQLKAHRICNLNVRSSSSPNMASHGLQSTADNGRSLKGLCHVCVPCGHTQSYSASPRARTMPPCCPLPVHTVCMQQLQARAAAAHQDSCTATLLPHCGADCSSCDAQRTCTAEEGSCSPGHALQRLSSGRTLAKCDNGIRRYAQLLHLGGQHACCHDEARAMACLALIEGCVVSQPSQPVTLSLAAVRLAVRAGAPGSSRNSSGACHCVQLCD